MCIKGHQGQERRRKLTLLLLLTYLVVPYHLKMNILYYVYWLCYYSEGHGKKEVGDGKKTGISNLHHRHTKTLKLFIHAFDTC